MCGFTYVERLFFIIRYLLSNLVVWSVRKRSYAIEPIRVSPFLWHLLPFYGFYIGLQPLVDPSRFGTSLIQQGCLRAITLFRSTWVQRQTRPGYKGKQSKTLFLFLSDTWYISHLDVCGLKCCPKGVSHIKVSTRKIGKAKGSIFAEESLSYFFHKQIPPYFNLRIQWKINYLNALLTQSTRLKFKPSWGSDDRQSHISWKRLRANQVKSVKVNNFLSFQ